MLKSDYEYLPIELLVSKSGEPAFGEINFASTDLLFFKMFPSSTFSQLERSTLKSIFAPAFPCLTGLLRAPRWVSQRRQDADVLLDAFSLTIVLADPETTLLPARRFPWLSKVGLRWGLLLSVRHLGITVPTSELVLRTIFPRWMRVTRSTVAVSWPVRRSRASRVTWSVALLAWSLLAMAAWTSISCGSGACLDVTVVGPTDGLLSCVALP